MARAYLFLFCKDFLIGIFWTFWAASFLIDGKSISDAATMLACFFLFSAVFEYPTGVFADRYGRKLSSLLGLSLLATGFLLKATGTNWMVTLFAFAACGVGITFISAASTVWIVHSAAEFYKKSSQDLIFESQIAGRLAMLFACYVGDHLLQSNSSLIWTYSFAIGLLGLIVGLSIPEATEERQNETLVSLTRKTLVAIKSPNVLLLVMGAGFFGIESGIRNVIWTPYVLNLQVGDYDWIAKFAATMAIIRLMGLLSYRIFIKRKYDSERYASILLTLSVAVFAIAEVNAIFATSYIQFIAPYGFAIFFFGWYFAFRDILVFQATDSRNRASVLSFMGLSELLLSALGCMIAGATLTVSASSHIWGMASISLCFAVACYFFSSRNILIKTFAKT